MSVPGKIALYIEPPTHHFRNDGFFNRELCKFGGDELLAPWIFLRDHFAARGVPVHSADLMPPEGTSSRNVYVSVGNTKEYRRVARRKDTVLSAFLALECPVVEPSVYRALPKVQQAFKRILSWSDSKALEYFVGTPIQCESFRWPQSFEQVHEPIWSNTARKFLVMMNSNKLPRVYFQELYMERMRAVEFFSRTDEIDLYGPGWDRPSARVGTTWMPWTFRRAASAVQVQWQKLRPNPLLVAARRVYRGTAKSKRHTIGQYTFALCFENSILKGWITEKIFDCIFAGTVPVYWGAPDIEEAVPRECFIDMRDFADYAELRDFLRSLTPAQIGGYRDSGREYLKSPRFRPFTRQAFADLFCRIIEEDTGMKIAPYQG
jgi:hypothetical protein